MRKGDLEIGPCYTYLTFRGKGIYPKVLSKICAIRACGEGSFYMIVDESNIPSIKGIEKAGFIQCGKVKKGRFLKRYYMVQ